MASIQTTGNGQVVRGAKSEQSLATTSPADNMANLLKRMGPAMSKAIPKHLDADRMARITLTALRQNPKLGECTEASFVGAVLSAAQLGLEPNTPLAHCYLIPYANGGKQEVQLQIGYQGMLALARRSGQIASIYAEAVYRGDDFSWTLGLERSLKHGPSTDELRDEQPITHVYAVAKLKSGDAVFVVLTRGQIERYKKRGRGQQPAWSTDWEAMAKKTAIRRLFTWIPRSAEMAGAQALDEAPELGKVSVVNFDAETVRELDSAGLSLAQLTAHDPDTGEVSAPAMREMGDE